MCDIQTDRPNYSLGDHDLLILELLSQLKISLPFPVPVVPLFGPASLAMLWVVDVVVVEVRLAPHRHSGGCLGA